MGIIATVDASGKVIGIELSPYAKATGDSTDPPPEGSVEIPEIDGGLVMALYNSGQTIEIDKENIKANGVIIGRMKP